MSVIQPLVGGKSDAFERCVPPRQDMALIPAWCTSTSAMPRPTPNGPERNCRERLRRSSRGSGRAIFRTRTSTLTRLRAQLVGVSNPTEWLRRPRYEWRFQAMDGGLVVIATRGRCTEGVLPPGKVREACPSCEPRSSSAGNRNCAQRVQRRLTSVRTEQLLPLPAARHAEPVDPSRATWFLV